MPRRRRGEVQRRRSGGCRGDRKVEQREEEGFEDEIKEKLGGGGVVTFPSVFLPSFTHRGNLALTRKLKILCSKINIVTHRIIDLFILIAKHHIFYGKDKGYHTTCEYTYYED